MVEVKKPQKRLKAKSYFAARSGETSMEGKMVDGTVKSKNVGGGKVDPVLGASQDDDGPRAKGSK